MSWRKVTWVVQSRLKSGTESSVREPFSRSRLARARGRMVIPRPSRAAFSSTAELVLVQDGETAMS